ncbi:MAG: hypothetical protein ACD_64C00214G0003 [uncultured bacterium]|nr:MAG: hypothetical protein ACD_64C00214G0003 [uncultured bacterium]
MQIMRFWLAILWSTSLIASPYHDKTYTIMIDPSGDAQHTGRTIDDTFERALTLSIAHALEKALKSHAHCTVIITRSAGEIVSPLQHANFSNRLPVDLFITLSCYQNEQEKPSLSLYTLSFGEPCMKLNHHTFLPFDKAHHACSDRTKEYSQAIALTLRSPNGPNITTHGPYAIPCAPLIGITAPAIMIELCLTHKTSWTPWIDPVATAVIGALKS